MLTLHYLCSLVIAIAPFAKSSDWSYHGEHGPDHWPAICSFGKAQSPINIPTRSKTKLVQTHFSPFVFNGYDQMAKTAHLQNNGHTMQLSLEPRRAHKLPYISGGGLDGRYIFAQFHFHWGSSDDHGSEHTINGDYYPMELHLVHFKRDYGTTLTQAVTTSKGANDTLAVLGILFEIQEEDNEDLEQLTDALDKIEARDDEIDMAAFPMVTLLPRNTDGFYRYYGSLTTPGCNEVVVWTLFKTKVGISHKQLERFRILYEEEKGSEFHLQDNFRPVQNLQGRKIYDVETSEKHFRGSANTNAMSAVIIMSVLPLMIVH